MDERYCFQSSREFKVINKTMYIAVGLHRNNKKEVFRTLLAKNKSAAF
ncbi:hypothetical protein TSEDIMI_390003 [Tenacibaculum sediminilitoris]